MKLFKLDKVVVSVKNNPSPFLNGLTSNTLDQPHNAFLNVHGRIIATFDQVRASEDEFLILVEKRYREAVLQHLEKFARLSGVVLMPRDEFQVYFDLTGDYASESGEFLIPQRAGQLVVTAKALDSTVSRDEFTLFRLKNHLPIHGQDYRDEFLLNIFDEGFVSYSKGCFLGQEPIAKVHNRSKPTWKLVVKNVKETPNAQRVMMTSEARDPATGQMYGFVLVRNE